MRSSWIRLGPAVAALALWASPMGAEAQDDLARLCTRLEGGVGECHVAAAGVRLLHPRLGLALWGGSPVPGSASTLGMRLGTMPRLSFSTRVVVVPVALAPLVDRGDRDGGRTLRTGFSTQATVGLLTGFSPVPTVGGVLSLDAIGRVSYVPLPEDAGFTGGGVWGWSAALRLGALRESFTLPGISLTGRVGRSTGVTYGDPSGSTDGYLDGAMTSLGATLAATKRFSALGITAGVAIDRYGGDVELGYRPTPLGARVEESAAADTDRWSGFVNASWTFLVVHGVAELGWQEAPRPEGLPADVSVDPAAWWAGVALRLSI